jgi:hypothetical protein
MCGIIQARIMVMFSTAEQPTEKISESRSPALGGCQQQWRNYQCTYDQLFDHFHKMN